jgi:hypothetical protein
VTGTRAEIMEGDIQAGTILIEEGAYNPAALPLVGPLVGSLSGSPKGAPATKGWKSVEPIDRRELERNISQAGLIFYLMADEIKATVFGFDRQKALRAALKRIIASVKLQKCNSLQITEVTAKSFLKVPYVSVSAHSRHIQERPSFDGQ